MFFLIPGKEYKQSPPFWEQDIYVFDSYMNVGVRSHYFASQLAVPLMLKNDTNPRGIIINISSFGAKYYMFNVAYGTGKSAIERLSKDMATDLKKTQCLFSNTLAWSGKN